MVSTWTVSVVLTLSALRLPVALSLTTFLTVLALTASPSWMRLKACHMSSGSSGTIVISPAPSFSRDLCTSFMVSLGFPDLKDPDGMVLKITGALLYCLYRQHTDCMAAASQ